MGKSVLVFGEVLFDIFENKTEIGGAPFNFAAHYAALGGEVQMVSAVGEDALGRVALGELEKRGVGRKYFSTVNLPTGSCKVTLKNGTPSYELASNVAYDHIPYIEPEEEYDALYFGTLAQRRDISRNTVSELLRRNYREVLLDVNVRKPYLTREILKKSIEKATIVKISREEASYLLPYTSPEHYCETMLAHFPQLHQVILTLDKDGAYVCDRQQGGFLSPKPCSKALSTVGAGDSFCAAYLFHVLSGHSIPTALEAATVLSDYVVTQLGAVPPLPDELRCRILKGEAPMLGF